MVVNGGVHKAIEMLLDGRQLDAGASVTKSRRRSFPFLV